MVFRNNGEISVSSVFILHFWSLVRKAFISSPLLSVIIVEYSTLSWSGKIQLSKKNVTTNATMAIANIFKTRSEVFKIRLLFIWITETKMHRNAFILSKPAKFSKAFLRKVPIAWNSWSCFALTNNYQRKFANGCPAVLIFLWNFSPSFMDSPDFSRPKKDIPP